LIEVFAEPQELMAGTVKVGDPIAVLPTLFHLLWRRAAHRGPGGVAARRGVAWCSPDRRSDIR